MNVEKKRIKHSCTIWFHMKKRRKNSDSLTHVTACPLDILVMEGNFQRDYRHQIIPCSYESGPRINFTFRTIINHCPGWERGVERSLKWRFRPGWVNTIKMLLNLKEQVLMRILCKRKKNCWWNLFLIFSLTNHIFHMKKEIIRKKILQIV